MRPLSREEAELWERVTASIRPLSREPPAAAAEPPALDTVPTSAEPTPPSLSPRPKPSAPPPAPRPGITLDGSWDRRLKAGAVEPDQVVDLHGMNLDRAWRTIDTALEQAIGSGKRVVLLITGHQRSGEPPVQRGKIRAAVHDWLAASRHAGSIAAVRAAHRRHGGGGSLYLILRRR
jgi:DNA-nicking Smr family endonuclease